MNKLFLRAFGFLVFAIVATALVCAVLTGLINTVRSIDYKTQRVTPLFTWLASPAHHESFLGHNKALSQFSLQIIPISEAPLTRLQLERLGYGQVVVSDEQEGGVRVDVKYGADHVLETDLVNFYQDWANLTEKVVIHWLLNIPASDRELALKEASIRLGVRISLLQDEHDKLPQMVLDGLAAKNQAVYWPDVSKPLSQFIRFQDGLVYRIDYPAPFQPVSWPVILVLLLVSLGCLGATVFVIVSSVDQRLKRLETLATRISRGELDARMVVQKNDSIGRVGDAFNRMAEHIQRLVNVQKEMIHAVSHELRTPVARIRFGVQMIEDCPNKESLQKQLKGIDGDIQELDELIDEILTYARLEQGGPILSFHNTNIRAVVEQVVMEQSGVKPDMEITAEFAQGSDQWCQSEVEERYIHRSIQNLVGNASRYAKSRVKVCCQFDRETCRVDVEDDGPGIPESEWETVFTPFARLDDSRTRSSGGYGLGLSIVRRILYWHGGQAFLGRSTMGGAKFSLVWPRLQVSKENV